MDPYPDAMAMTTMTPVEPERPHRRARTVIVLGAVVLAAAVAVVLALFQPWKLWVDETVDQPAPARATPLADPASSPTTTAAAPITTVASAPASAAPASAPPAPTAAATPAPTPPPTTVPVATQFVSLDHGTSGLLVLLQDQAGQRFARFENLDTSNGPDLKVYLSTNPVDGPEGAFDDDFVNLGGLQGNVGSQNYLIPADADLSRFRSVVIWCDRFDSAFGAAPLG